MGLIARHGGDGDFELIPEGVHLARCIGIYDIGHHTNPAFDKRQHKVVFTWELPNVLIDVEKDGETKSMPRATSRFYTLSLDDRAWLKQHLVAWRGKSFTQEEEEAFDLKKVLGAACQLQIVHEASSDGKKTYANIGSIMALPAGATMPEAVNPLRFFSFEDGYEVPEGTPAFIMKHIEASEEWQDRLNGEAAMDDENFSRTPGLDGDGSFVDEAEPTVEGPDGAEEEVDSSLPF